jgi:predicted Zn-dependent peptidase
MNMYADTPRDHIGTIYETLMYGDNPLGWEILGTKDTVRGATRETFLDYIGEWYTPDRMIVGVSGKVGDALEPMLEELLGDMSPNGERLPAPAELDASRPRVSVQHKDADQAHLILGVPSYPIEHPDRYVLQLLTTVLGGGMSSRLFTEVRERRGLAYYVHGVNHSYTDAGSLYAQAGVDLNRIDDAVSVIAEEFQKMADEAVPSDELEKARSLSKGRFVLRTESPQGLLMFGLNREVLEGSALEPEQYLAALDSVTVEDVQRVAQDLIARDRLHLAVIGPFDDDERFSKLLAA